MLLMVMLLQGLPCGVGQEEAHQAAAGEQYGDDEGRRGAVGVEQGCDHHVANDTTQASGYHGHSYTSCAEMFTDKLEYIFGLSIVRTGGL